MFWLLGYAFLGLGLVTSLSKRDWLAAALFAVWGVLMFAIQKRFRLMED